MTILIILLQIAYFCRESNCVLHNSSNFINEYDDYIFQMHTYSYKDIDLQKNINLLIISTLTHSISYSSGVNFLCRIPENMSSVEYGIKPSFLKCSVFASSSSFKTISTSSAFLFLAGLVLIC